MLDAWFPIECDKTKCTEQTEYGYASLLNWSGTPTAYKGTSLLLFWFVLYYISSMIILSSNRWRKSDFCGECRTLDLATLIWHNYRTFTYLSSFNTFINEIICLFWLIKWTWYSVLGLFPSICENFHKLRADVNFLLAHFVLTTALKLKIGEMLNASCSVHIYVGRAILRNAQCSAKFSLIVRAALEVRAKCNSYA